MFPFVVVKFSIYLNRRVSVMVCLLLFFFCFFLLFFFFFFFFFVLFFFYVFIQSEIKWLEHLWDHGNLFDIWVVRVTEC